MSNLIAITGGCVCGPGTRSLFVRHFRLATTLPANKTSRRQRTRSCAVDNVRCHQWRFCRHSYDTRWEKGQLGQPVNAPSSCAFELLAFSHPCPRPHPHQCRLPGERLKVLMQSQSQGAQNVQSTIRNLWSHGGMRSLYRGWGACLSREVLPDQLTHPPSESHLPIHLSIHAPIILSPCAHRHMHTTPPLSAHRFPAASSGSAPTT